MVGFSDCFLRQCQMTFLQLFQPYNNFCLFQEVSTLRSNLICPLSYQLFPTICICLPLPIVQNLNCNLFFPNISNFQLSSLIFRLYVPYSIVVNKNQIFPPFCINSMKCVQTNMIRAISCLNLNKIVPVSWVLR